jgi:hypothetical protein
VRTVFWTDCKILKRPDKKPEFRPNFRASKKPAQTILVRGEDILTDICSQMVVTDKLRHSLECYACRGHEAATQVVDDRERDAPVSADFLQHSANLVMIFRPDFLAFENLPAERIETNQQYAASFFASTVDMQDVAAAISHVGTKQSDAFVVNHLEIGNELSGKIVDGTDRHFDAIMTGKFGSDLVTLAAFEKPQQTDSDQNIIGILCARGDDMCQLLGPGYGNFRVRWTVALPFNGGERTIGGRENIASFRSSNMQGLPAARTTGNVIFPGKYKLGDWEDIP